MPPLGYGGPSPTKGVKLALIDEKPPFMTWEEIETIIKRGGLTEEQQKTYWDCLFLDEKQVLEFLGYVHEKAGQPFIHAAVAFAAFTGARRSEIVRSQIEDGDFERGNRPNPREERQPEKEDHVPRGQSPPNAANDHGGVVQDPLWRPLRHHASIEHGEQPEQTSGAVAADPRSSPRPLPQNDSREQVAGSQGLARPAPLVLFQLCPAWRPGYDHRYLDGTPGR